MLPSKPRVVKEEALSATFEIDGLYPGYGHTLGNSLRRIILSSLPGAAITSIKVDGVSHEFSTMDGVQEDVITILLNLKKVRIKLSSEEAQSMSLKIKGPAVVTAGDITAPGQVEILNPELVVCHINGKIELDIDIEVERGVGYVPKEELQKDRVEIGSISIDANFSPIRRVNYEVENMRVGDRTNFNRLRIFIETDGTISPREVLDSSVRIMIDQLKAVVGFQEPVEASEEEVDSLEEGDEPDSEFLKTRIDTLGLSTRTENALVNANIRTVGGLVRKKKSDLLAMDGLGKKSLDELEELLSSNNITLKE